ncbi:hypothetical protein R1flu_023164 [Riccia fluitans]|uniref:Phospholipid/glycerol acyltransferase domain-containing protein n=1 Tax=Riccia fluitans TaxID=41844 RepID=A0ABD1XRD9_9MARC
MGKLAKAKANGQCAFEDVYHCSSNNRRNQTIVADLDGTMLLGRSSFPYFMLVAFEAGGFLRASILLLLSPIAYILYHFVSESAGIKLLCFVSFVGLKARRIEVTSRAVLPKFYTEDVHPESWRVFSSFGKSYVLTANPRIMVEVFAKEYLGADEVIGSELEVTKGGRATGFLKAPGVCVGENKAAALREKLGDLRPDVGLGDRETDHAFMSLCKEAYMVPEEKDMQPLPRDMLLKKMVFHDGRFVQLPTPGVALICLLWAPIGFLIAAFRIGLGMLPFSIALTILRMTGVRVIVKGTPPEAVQDGRLGVLFVCSHRCMLDPVMLSVALRRRVCAVTYSISRVSELMAPIPTVALSRDRDQDAAMIKKLLEHGDLVICPEGTTCRERFLLRFSALFAELTDRIVPVATDNKMGMFYGTTATGWKGMDAFFYFMNPRPLYEITFLDQLPQELTIAGGKTSHEVANYVQRVIAGALNFECTNLTRKDKYLALAGNDGSVTPRKNSHTKLNGLTSN